MSRCRVDRSERRLAGLGAGGWRPLPCEIVKASSSIQSFKVGGGVDSIEQAWTRAPITSHLIIVA